MYTWKQLRPPLLPLPPRFWAIAGAAVLALLSYALRRELWPNHPQAADWSLNAFLLLLLAGGGQVVVALWHWPATYAGPAGVRLLLRAGALLTATGLSLLLFLLALGGVWGVCSLL